MTQSAEHFLGEIRYGEDRRLAEKISEDSGARPTDGTRREHRESIRKRLLATAVRVDPRMLPKLDASIRAVRQRAQLDEHIEAYVFEEATINAFLTTGVKHTYLGLSSGAVNTLSETELEFVIGHELGHAVFGHVDFAPTTQLQDENLDTRARQHLLAWMRASEISADRCGLVCCGSLQVAATAMFRTLSGINLPGLQIRPEHFSEQWDHLLTEVIEHGGDSMWQTSHPFPPMRMKAMTMFWESDAPMLPTDRARSDVKLVSVDEQIARLLATIDPLARAKRGAEDPLLEDIVLWGGFVVAYRDGDPDTDVMEQIRTSIPAAYANHNPGTTLTQDACLERLREALSTRRKKLKAIEIHRVLSSLLNVCDFAEEIAGETMNARWSAFCKVGSVLGLDENACATVRKRHLDRQSGN